MEVSHFFEATKQHLNNSQCLQDSTNRRHELETDDFIVFLMPRWFYIQFEN